jgi:very-short-patch-repair endonuclease
METSLEARVQELAAAQHGVVTRAQLLALGLTARMIARRVAQQRLWPLHRGVYRVGPDISPYAGDMAAVLACGAGALLSHWSAASLVERERPSRPPARGPARGVDVTVIGRDCGVRPGIRSHRVSRLDAAELTVLHGIPTTTPSRTLLDLAFELVSKRKLRELERVVTRWDSRGIASAGSVLELLARHRYRRGAGRLRAIAASLAEPALTRSKAEELFRRLVRTALLPEPAVNVVVAGCEVDFMWAAARVIVEVDGYAFHSARDRFENDRDRDVRLEAAGYTVIRVTWRQVTREPVAVIGPIAFLLGQRGAAA